jgi:tetratricopeptide (TPR) repeat protein
LQRKENRVLSFERGIMQHSNTAQQDYFRGKNTYYLGICTSIFFVFTFLSEASAQLPPALEMPDPLRTAKSIYQNRIIRPDDLQAQYLRLEELLEEGAYRTMLQEGMSLYMLDSTQERLLVLMAEAARLGNDQALFYRMVGNIKQLYPLNGTAWVIEAIAAQQQGMDDNAVKKLLDQALRREATLSTAWYQVALLESRQKHEKKALTAAKKALRYASVPYDAAMLYGFLLLQKSTPSYRKALPLFELALRSEKEGLAGVYAGYCAFMLGKGTYADSILTSFSVKYPRFPLAYILRAAHYNSLHENAKTITVLRAMLQNAGENYPYMRHAGLTEILNRMDRGILDSVAVHTRLKAVGEVLLLDDACLTERVYKDLSHLGGDTCLDHTIVIWSAVGFSGGCTEKALGSINAAYACDTISIFIQALLASIYQELNQPDYALYYLQAAIAYGGRYPDLLFSAATLAKERGQYLLSKQYFEELKPELSSNPVLWSAYAVTLMATGDTASAQALFERTIAVQPPFSEPYKALAAIYASKGSFQAALNMADEALRRQQDATVYYLRAKLRDTLGFDSNVEEDLIACLELSPHFIPALQQLAVHYRNNLRLPEYCKAVEVLLLSGRGEELPYYVDYLLEIQDSGRAMKSINQLKQDFPNDRNALKAAAFGYVRLRQWEEAATVYTEIQRMGDTTFSYLKVAVLCCYLMTGDKERTYEMIEKERFNPDPSFQIARGLFLLYQFGRSTVHPNFWPLTLEPQADTAVLGQLLRMIAGNRGVIAQVPLATIAPWLMR